MRVIEGIMCNAVIDRNNIRRDNTRVWVEGEWTKVYLHGNCIAEVSADLNTVYIDNCGWETRTTQSRLNALMSAMEIPIRVFTKNRRMYVKTPNGSVRFNNTFGYHREGVNNA